MGQCAQNPLGAPPVRPIQTPFPAPVNVILPEAFERRSLRIALARSTPSRLAAQLWQEPNVVLTQFQ
jgi:hypothetical protein